MLKTGQPLDFSFGGNSNKQFTPNSNIKTNAMALFNSLNTPDLVVQPQPKVVLSSASQNQKTKILYKPQPLQVIFEETDAPENSEGPSAVKRSSMQSVQQSQLKNPPLLMSAPPSQIVSSPHGSIIMPKNSKIKGGDSASAIRKQLSLLREKSLLSNGAEQIPVKPTISQVSVVSPAVNILENVPNRIRFQSPQTSAIETSVPQSKIDQQPPLQSSSPIFLMSKALNGQARENRPATPTFSSQPTIPTPIVTPIVKKSIVIQPRPTVPHQIIYDQEVTGGHGYAGYTHSERSSESGRKPQVLHTTTTAQSLEKLPETQRPTMTERMRVSYPGELIPQTSFFQKWFCCKRSHSPTAGQSW